jgi:lambda family phage portal protein
MLGFISKLFSPPKLRTYVPDPFAGSGPPAVALGQLSPWRYSFDDGSKFAGGYGPTQLLFTDYWTLRARSSELFETNLYARGIVRRLVTNEINVGLHLEATPEEAILGKPEDSLADWSETVENRFQLWCDRPTLCDQAERQTFGSLQATARMEALIDGDVLVVLRQDQRTGLPRVQLIKGSQVQTPFDVQPSGGANIIRHGVETDPSGRHVAYYVAQADGKSKRLPAFGEKSGRRLAWLVYGTDRRLDDVRGKPLLSIVLQSLKEIDRYRDSTQRKALVLSMLAMFIKKGEAFSGTRPLTSGAVRRGSGVPESATPGQDRRFSIQEHIPGTVFDELQQGEEPVAFKVDGSTENFGIFEEAIVQCIAWGLEIPPEILTLSFNSNYSASQAAINEFKMYLNKVRSQFGDDFAQPIYSEWLLSEVTAKKIAAPGLLDAWRDSSQYDTFAAWISADWSGQIKPAVDLSKLVAGYDAMIEGGFITRDRAARELSGTKYSKNVQKLKRENEQLAEANAPMAALALAGKAHPPVENDAGAADAKGQGEDGKDDGIEGLGGYPRRRLALLAGK